MATESPPLGLNTYIMKEFIFSMLCLYVLKIVGFVFWRLYKKILLSNELKRHQAGCLILINEQNGRQTLSSCLKLKYLFKKTLNVHAKVAIEPYQIGTVGKYRASAVWYCILRWKSRWGCCKLSSVGP